MSSASSGGKSLAVLIKKAMAKIPASLDTKKSIDEYYKTAMKEIVMEMKAEAKAKADAMKAKGKTVKKPKKVGGGMTKEELKKELEIIDKIMELFIDYKVKGQDYFSHTYRDNDDGYNKGLGYFSSEEYQNNIKRLVELLNRFPEIKGKIEDDKFLKDGSIKEYLVHCVTIPYYRKDIYDALTVYIKDIYIIIATRHYNSYNKYKTGDKYAQLYLELYK
jgi:hypothetical protein